MKIGVINEVSASQRNEDIVQAIREATDAEVLNFGMKHPEEEPQLTYIQTSYMAAILLGTKACDFVVSGCGTGQGFLNAVMQFPGVSCGLIADPWMHGSFPRLMGKLYFSSLNKGYGWAADINLKYIFEKLFADPLDRGTPKQGSEPGESRKILSDLSRMVHKSLAEILKNTDVEILRPVVANQAFMDAVTATSEEEIKNILKNIRP